MMAKPCRAMLGASVLMGSISGCNEGDTLEQKARDAIERLKSTPLNFEVNCPMDAMFTVSNCEPSLKRGPFVSPPAKGLIDVSLVSINLQSEGATITQQNGNAALTLYSGATTLATGYFVYTMAGGQVQFADPAGVNTWIDSFNGVDAFELKISNVQVASARGSNSVTATEQVVGSPVSSATFGWSYSGGPELSPTPPPNL